jgi:hypothetical protein
MDENKVEDVVSEDIVSETVEETVSEDVVSETVVESEISEESVEETVSEDVVSEEVVEEEAITTEETVSEDVVETEEVVEEEAIDEKEIIIKKDEEEIEVEAEEEEDEEEEDEEEVDEKKMSSSEKLDQKKYRKSAAGKKAAKAFKKKVSKSSYKPDKKRSKIAKKSAKFRKEDIDMTSDVDVLMSGEDLSEEFKDKAKVIFEAAVHAKSVEEIDRMHGIMEETVAEAIDEEVSILSEKVSTFMDYAVSEWSKDNAVALESGLRSEITESFLLGMRDLMIENHVDLPEEKVSIVESQFDEIQELTAKLNESESKQIDLFGQINEQLKKEILSNLSGDLSVTEKEKFGELAESVDFESSELYEEKLTIIKDKYFPSSVVVSEESADVAVSGSSADESGRMADYLSAITKYKV